jgi:hypothetical protein
MNGQEESKITSRALGAVEKRFPHYADLARKLARESETFREICMDFVECGETLDQLAKVSERAEARIQEYTDLQAQLEQELLECLEIRSTREGCVENRQGESGTRSNRPKDSNNRT